MCGFAGVVAWEETFRVSRETLGRMSARVAHRGPDGEGIYLSAEGTIDAGRPQVGLVHRRLAILDLDPRANQPFGDGTGRWIVFNGEIYNFRELRSELSRLRPEYAWRTTGDTEVLLLAYDAWGEGCVSRLDGMFAFAVWDGPAGALFLARDRMGQKPLYFGLAREGDARGIAFGSEIGAVLQAPWVAPDVSDGAVLEYLRWGYVPHPGTMYRGVAQLSPGETMTFSAGRRTGGGRYFDPARGTPAGEAWPTRASDEKAIDLTRARVVEAVKRQLVADVPVGCFLSGGVDSSVVAAMMKRAVAPGQEALTFSIGFDDPRYDETAYAERIALHLGTRHHRFTVRADAAADLPSVAEAFGEPFGDSSALPTWYLALATRPHVKVALSGDGGDELFGGYDRYRAMRLGRWLRPVGFAARPLAALLPGTHPKSTAARAKRFARTLSLDAPARYASYVGLMDERLIRELAGRDLPSHDPGRDPESVYRMLLGRHRLDPVRAALATDRATYLPDDLLTKVDRCSMRFGLEVRAPFMDPGVVGHAAGLTQAQLLRGGPKRMLREAFAADLPGWVFERKKMGFAVPIGEWFRGPLRPMLHDHLFCGASFAAEHFAIPVVRRLVDEHGTRRADHSQRLYALLMLELWWRQSRA